MVRAIKVPRLNRNLFLVQRDCRSSFESSSASRKDPSTSARHTTTATRRPPPAARRPPPAARPRPPASRRPLRPPRSVVDRAVNGSRLRYGVGVGCAMLARRSRSRSRAVQTLAR